MKYKELFKYIKERFEIDILELKPKQIITVKDEEDNELFKGSVAKLINDIHFQIEAENKPTTEVKVK